MAGSDMDLQALRKQVEVRVRRAKMVSRWAFFSVSLVLFAALNIIAWGMVSASGSPIPEALPGALIMLDSGWLVALVFQLISALFDTKAMEDSMRQQAVGQVLNLRLLQLGDEEALEKRKRMMTVGDDGELEAVAGDLLLTEEATQEAMRR